MSVSVSETAFEGFRLMRRQPSAVLGWGLFYLAAGLVLGGLVIAVVIGRVGSLENADAALGAVWPALLVAGPALLLVFAVLSGAIYRSVLRPDERRLAYLRIGSAELRLCLVMIVTTMILGLATLLGFIVIAAFGQIPAPFGGIAAVLAGLALFAGIAWISVRLSLAGPMTLVRTDLPFGASWRLTKGRFWPLFGAYVIAWLCSIAVALAASVAMGALGGGMSAAAMMSGDFSLAPAAVAGLIVYVVLQVALSIVQFALTAAPGAAAYRQIGMRTRVEDNF